MIGGDCEGAFGRCFQTGEFGEKNGFILVCFIFYLLRSQYYIFKFNNIGFVANLLFMAMCKQEGICV